MPTMNLTDREVALVLFHRMTPDQQQAERARVKAAAREAALARLSPAQRAIAEQRKAAAKAAAEAEQARVAALTPDERIADRALREKARAEATLASIDPAAVAKASAAIEAKAAKPKE
jgi:hypothetical protein